jgi:hypothetical protein
LCRPPRRVARHRHRPRVCYDGLDRLLLLPASSCCDSYVELSPLDRDRWSSPEHRLSAAARRPSAAVRTLACIRSRRIEIQQPLFDLRLNLDPTYEIHPHQGQVPVNPADLTLFANEPLVFLCFAKRSIVEQRSLHKGPFLHVLNP